MGVNSRVWVGIVKVSDGVSGCVAERVRVSEKEVVKEVDDDSVAVMGRELEPDIVNVLEKVRVRVVVGLPSVSVTVKVSVLDALPVEERDSVPPDTDTELVEDVVKDGDSVPLSVWVNVNVGVGVGGGVMVVVGVGERVKDSVGGKVDEMLCVTVGDALSERVSDREREALDDAVGVGGGVMVGPGEIVADIVFALLERESVRVDVGLMDCDWEMVREIVGVQRPRVVVKTSDSALPVRVPVSRRYQSLR